MSTLVTTVRDLFRYRGAVGQLAWIGHRLAGLGTLLFFTLHVVDTSWVYFWPEGYEHAIALYRHPVFFVGELLLVAAVIYHGVNGLRVALMDWQPRLWHYEQQMALGVFALTALLYLPAAFIMIRHLVTA
ncbi:MAG TPA: succinate dehydrogenase, cytochrome b556 subunit [Aggregatilineales bacterium]|nr:succinate dehydrogenase, cytochrome b556 subunit [Aggregatilineales bacterium]